MTSTAATRNAPANLKVAPDLLTAREISVLHRAAIESNRTARALLHPLHVRCLRNNPCLVPHVEQPLHRFPAVLAIVEGALVNVHADKFIRELSIEIAGELHSIAERFFAMIDGVLDTLA